MRLQGSFFRSVALMGLLFCLVGCDHVTKALAKSELEARPAHALIDPVLKLRYVENTDVAFNLLRWVPLNVREPLLLVVGALAILSVGALLLSGRLSGRARGGLLLVLAGAIGNYADRVWRGYVVDFIHVPHWPVFNVADVLIVVGGVLLLSGHIRPGSARWPRARA
jgi:signal peptidase II